MSTLKLSHHSVTLLNYAPSRHISSSSSPQATFITPILTYSVWEWVGFLVTHSAQVISETSFSVNCTGEHTTNRQKHTDKYIRKAKPNAETEPHF